MNIIELAKESGLAWVARKRLERFAALVRAEALAEQIPEWVDVDDYKEPVKQEPVAWATKISKAFFNSPANGVFQVSHLMRDEYNVPLYAAPVDAKAIRAEEQEKFRKIAEAVLGWVYAGDRDKPFNDADFVGEMVRIRLTGLTLLAEIVRPGCREQAIKKFTEQTAAAIRGLK